MLWFPAQAGPGPAGFVPASAVYCHVTWSGLFQFAISPFLHLQGRTLPISKGENEEQIKELKPRREPWTLIKH